MYSKIDLNQYSLNEDSKIIEALKVINKGEALIGLVLNDYKILVGVITDGDIRRSLLSGLSLNDSIKNVYNNNFEKIHENESIDKAKNIMRAKGISAIPIVNKNGMPIDIITHNSLELNKAIDNPILIMAGGKGKRLRPLTLECPKPMILLENKKPILEIILERIKNYGFKNVFLSVNYKKERIIDYFKNGENFGLNIEYIIEDEPLGTGGALSLLPGSIKKPIIVMNGDIITGLNFLDLLKFHNELSSQATMCVRELGFKMQFGVIKTNGTKLQSIEEKPIINSLINAGIYVLNPDFIKTFLPSKRKIDITDLFLEGKKMNRDINVFPLHEYWIDIGLPDSLDKARKEFNDFN